jgi:hypothetical protein
VSDRQKREMPRALADRGEELYAENRWLRAGVALIPGVGGAIDSLIAVRGQKLAQERIERLIADLRATAAGLSEEKLDRAFLNSEAFDDLTLRAFRAAAETRDREKTRLYAAILVGAVDSDRDRTLDPEAVLSSVAELAPVELELARAIYRMQKTDPDRDLELKDVWDRGWNDEENFPSAARRDLAFYLKRIERTGLIEEFTGAYLDYGGGTYRTTRTFRRLMRHLERTDDPSRSSGDDRRG